MTKAASNPMTNRPLTSVTSEMMSVKPALRALCAAVLVAGLAGIAPAALAQPDSLQTIKELVAQGQFQRAYQQATAAEERYEGDPEFDFNYGLAALESGHYPEAVFILERVVLAEPDQLRVRVELARAKFLAGNYPGARADFETVLAQNPPPAVRANIQRFLDQIDAAIRSQKRELGAWLDARLGTDSNINSATDSTTINTPIGAFDLVQNGREQSDQFARWEVGGKWREPLARDTSFDLSASWQQKNNFGSDTFDLGIGLVESGYSRKLENGRYRVGVRLQNVVLDTSRFQNTYGVVGSWDHVLSRSLLVSLTGAATVVRYADDPHRDTDQYLASATLLRPTGDFMQSFTLYGAMEPARDGDFDFNGRNFYGALYNLQYDLKFVHPYLRLGAQKARYDGRHPVFAKHRDDTTLTASAGASYELWKGLMLTGEASYSDVNSNLPIFDYNRYTFEFGLRQTF